MKKLTLCLLITLFYIAGCQPEMDQSIIQDEEVPVQVVRIQRKSMSSPIHGTGLLSSVEESRLSFKTGGIIDNLRVNEGDFVTEGQMLASLKLNEIEAMAAQARSGFEKAERDYHRARNLYADSVVTLEQIQNAQTGRDVAKAQLEIAEFNLAHARIVAPEDGKILKRLAERNELISPGYPVFIFGSGRREWVLKTGLSDRDVVRCQRGDSAAVVFDAYPDSSFPARVHEIAGAPDPMSGLFEVLLKLQKPDVRLMTGFVGNAAIFPSDRSMVSLVPMTSLISGDGHHGNIFTVKDSTAVQIPVTVSFLTNETVALNEKLEDIELVVTEGASYLRPGSKVTIVPEFNE